MNKNVKRTLLAVMVSSMLAASFSAIPVAADVVTPPPAGSEGIVAFSNQVTLADNGLPAPVDGVITLTTGTYTLQPTEDDNTPDVTNPIVIPENQVVTLNLNGQWIRTSGDHAIHNKGTLTINGSGTVTNNDSTNQGHGALLNAPGATVIINGGNFSAGKWYTIKNLGNMTINETDQTNITRLLWDCTSSLIDNGWENDTDCGYEYSENSSVQLTINGGSFSYGINSIKNSVNANLDIYGGTFNYADESAIFNYSTVTIYGGTFSTASIGRPVLTNSKLYDSDIGEMTIRGGTYTAVNTQTMFGYVSGSIGGTINIVDGTFSTLGNATLFPSATSQPYIPEISGGSYNTSVPDEYLTSSVEATVKSGSDRMVVYTAIQDAVNAASNGDTVSVKQNNLSATVDPNKGIKFEVPANVTDINLTTPGGEKVEIGTDGSTVQTTFTATVNNVSTSYTKGQTVTISAPEYYNGHVFKNWVVSSGNVTLANPYSATTTFVMPAANVTVYAVYDEVTFVPVLPEQPTVTAPARDGWVKIGARWYLYDNGEKLTGWQKDGNTWYYLDEKGIMLCGGLTEIDGQTYYFYDWGGMASSWWYEDEDGNWFYFRGNGAMATSSWIEWKGEYYYVGADGKMLTNTTTPDGYRVDANGVWVR